MSERLYQASLAEAEAAEAELEAAESMSMTVAEYRDFCDDWNADMALHLHEL